MDIKKEASNIAFFGLILTGMVWVGKKLDKGWLRLLGRGSG